MVARPTTIVVISFFALVLFVLAEIAMARLLF